MATLTTNDSVKMLQETFCLVSAIIGNSTLSDGEKHQHLGRLQRLINDCQRQRPTGFDGKHGNLHTDTCGCEDK